MEDDSALLKEMTGAVYDFLQTRAALENAEADLRRAVAFAHRDGGPMDGVAACASWYQIHRNNHNKAHKALLDVLAKTR